MKPGQGENGGNSIKRAVKILKGSASTADRSEFLHEAEMMLDMIHPNLAKLVGVAVQQRPWLTVIEFCRWAINVLHDGCAQALLRSLLVGM